MRFKIFDFKLWKYKKLRKLGRPLLTQIAKTVPKDLFFQAAEDLNMLGRGKTIVMENEEEINFIMDRAIHDIPWHKQRWIEYICEHKIQDYTSKQQSFLKAHLLPHISLYEVLGIDHGRGVHLHDLFSSKQLFLTDIGFGTTAKKEMLLVTRIITFEGLNFTAGIAVTFQQQDKKQLVENFTFLYEKKKKEMTWEQLMRKYAPYFFIENREKDYTIRFA